LVVVALVGLLPHQVEITELLAHLRTLVQPSSQLAVDTVAHTRTLVALVVQAVVVRGCTCQERPQVGRVHPVKETLVVLVRRTPVAVVVVLGLLADQLRLLLLEEVAVLEQAIF